MKRPGPLRALPVTAIVLPLLALVFWLTALIASGLPAFAVVGVNVHGLYLTTYAGDPGQRPAPLSLSVLNGGEHDSADVLPSPTPTPSTAASSPSGVAKPSPSPTPSALLVPTPSVPALPPTPTPGSATITGQVTDSQTRQPIVAATVSLSPGGMSTFTDVSGDFTLQPGPGTYTVTASATNYNSASQTVTVSSGQRAALSFRLTSTTSIGSIAGTVTDAATQAPIVGATVTLSSGLIRVTDTNGNFSYGVVLSGTYTLTVSAVGYATQSQPVTVRAGRTTNAQIALTP